MLYIQHILSNIGTNTSDRCIFWSANNDWCANDMWLLDLTVHLAMDVEDLLLF